MNSAEKRSTSFKAPAWQARIPFWALACLFGLSLFLSGRLSRLFSAPFDSYVGFWLPSGFFIAGLLLTETRRWLWMVLVALPCTLAIDYGEVGGLWTSIGYFGANTAEAVVGAWLVRTFVAARPSFKSLREFFSFIGLGAGIPPAIAALIGVIVDMGSGSPRSLWAVGLTWWASESIAIVLVAPPLLIVLGDDKPMIFPELGRRRAAEALALLAITTMMVWLIAGQYLGISSTVKYAIIPLLLWAGIRFGVRGAVSINLLVGLVLGYFAAHDLHSGIASASGLHSNFYPFLFVSSLVSLVPAMVLRDRDTLISRLARESRKNETLLQTAMDGNHILDMEGNLLQFNEAFRKTLGYSREELASMNVIQWDDDAALASDLHARIRKVAEHGALFETKHRCRDGTRIDVEIIAAGIEIDGRPCLYCSARDITARKVLEQRLLQSQKLEAIGKLAGGVAHDFNNILTGMILNLEANELDPSIPEDVKASLRENKAMAERAARITEQLLLFARKHTMQVESIELNGSIANGLKLIERTIGEHIAVTFSPRVPELWIRGDARMLDQVVMNLSINARDAMPGGGRLSIESDRVELKAEDPEVMGGANPGPYACLQISDTGTGISSEVLPHVFEPFYTTKEVGKGTGLGLATVDGVMRQHGGWVNVRSTEGQGTTFVLYLPISEKRTDSEAAKPRDPVKGSRERILLVEDEEGVRKITATLLTRLGYDVAVAANGPQALSLFKDDPQGFDLVLTDVVMPGGFSGLQLADKLRALDADLKIVVMSGYTEQIMRDQELRGRGFSFIAKPFASTKLASVIRASLDLA